MVREFHACEGTTSLDVETAELIDGLDRCLIRLACRSVHIGTRPYAASSL